MKLGKILNIPRGQSCPDSISSIRTTQVKPRCALCLFLADQADNLNALDISDEALKFSMYPGLIETPLKENPEAKQIRKGLILDIAAECLHCKNYATIIPTYTER